MNKQNKNKEESILDNPLVITMIFLIILFGVVFVLIKILPETLGVGEGHEKVCSDVGGIDKGYELCKVGNNYHEYIEDKGRVPIGVKQEPIYEGLGEIK